MTTPTVARLLQENEDLRHRLADAEEALRALSAGEVDAVLVDGQPEQVLTLDAAEKPYWLLVAQLPHPAATLTVEGTIISCNHRFAALLGQPPQSLPGRPLRDFVAREAQGALETLLRAGPAADAQAEVALRQTDGTSRVAILGARRLREGIHGECLIVTDLTEQRHYQELKRTQEALHASEKRLRAADRRKDEFLAVLAHELRNPLAPIRNAVEILKAKDPADPEQVWARDVLDRQAKLMARLLDDLLDVSRIALEKVRLRTEPVALADVFDGALEISRPLIEAGRHHLTVELPREPVRLEADPMRLAQVLANLLNNAARYSADGSQIRLSGALQGDQVVVSVADSGGGIAPELLPSIFEGLSHPKPPTEPGAGLGVGLSLVKGLVELHRGTVEARSDGPGRGSEFVVRVPVVAGSSAEPQSDLVEEQEKPLTTRRILIVDDNRDSVKPVDPAALTRLVASLLSERAGVRDRARD
jgi:PAS domain S-box-containing protein